MTKMGEVRRAHTETRIRRPYEASERIREDRDPDGKAVAHDTLNGNENKVEYRPYLITEPVVFRS